MYLHIALKQAIATLHSALAPTTKDDSNIQASTIHTRPRLDAEILLAHVLHKSRVWLHTHDDYVLKHEEKQQFFSLIQQRAKHCPIEYLTHSASFFDMTLYVDSRVLIPRPESEILIQHVASLYKHIQATHTNNATHNPPTLIEVGVGSGALSIALARLLPDVSIIAIDKSPQALAVASRNIHAFSLEHRITLRCTSLLKDIDCDGVAMVFANPPYIAYQYPITPNLRYEPQEALFGGEDGSEILQALISACAYRNIPYLICEMGYNQQIIMKEALESSGYHAQFYKDLAGLDRGFIATKQLCISQRNSPKSLHANG